MSASRLSPFAVRLLLTLTAAVWAVTFVAGKVAGREATPFAAALWRFALAAAVLTPLAARSPQGLGASTLGPRGWLTVAASSLTGLALYNWFFLKGLALVPVGRGSAVVAATPTFIYLGSVLVFGEKLTFGRCLGLAAAALGTMWAVTMGRPWTAFTGGFGRGDALMLGCMASWVVYSLLGRPLTNRLSALAANAWTALGAVVLLLPMAALSGEPLGQFLDYGPLTWASIAFLGLGGTVLGFTCFYLAIDVLGPHMAGVYLNLVPVFGLLAGWLLQDEKPDASLAVGLALILFGVRLVQRR
ncbi:MAG: DMT family transporter [Deltaproteobacteria bacterium]|jgi:drug/metabolite transporter (DMT)-like permease|nr:DMT family transporter [Deltaproteobacteria bacterium]